MYLAVLLQSGAATADGTAAAYGTADQGRGSQGSFKAATDTGKVSIPCASPCMSLM